MKQVGEDSWFVGNGVVWEPLLRNSGGVGDCVCSGRPPLFSMLLSMLHSMPFGLSFSSACRQRGTPAGPRPASLRACVSKPFEFEARSTASNSLLSSPPAQPEASYIAALAVPLVNPSCSVAPLPRINAKPNPFCPCISSIFLAPLSSSHLIFGTLPSRSP